MTKETWNIQKRGLEIPMETWWEYYKENGGTLKSYEQFVHQFSVLLFKAPIMHSQGRNIQVNFNTALNRLYDYYNKKFE